MTIAILALQGAFAEHQQMLHTLGADTTLIRNLNDWEDYFNTTPASSRGLIIPGGESTAMMRIMRDEELLQPIRDAILSGLPTFGTCAGLILLDQDHLATMNIKARRNAYGRQLGSFHTTDAFTFGKPLTNTDGKPDNNSAGKHAIPMTFIRAPYIESAGEAVDILAIVDGRIVAARQGNQLATAFHPELDQDTQIHQYFLSIVTNQVG